MRECNFWKPAVAAVGLAVLLFGAAPSLAQEVLSPLDDFERLLNMVSRNFGRARQESGLDISEFRRLFEGALSDLDNAGRLLQSDLTRRGVTEFNFPRHVLRIRSVYFSSGKVRSGGLEDLSHTKDIAELHRMINRVRELGIYNNFRPPEPPPPEDVTPKEPALDRQAVFAQIQEERNRIMRGDQSIHGVESATLKAYLQTVSPTQRREFSTMVKDYVDRGWEREVAEATALRRFHGTLTNRPDLYSDRDLQRIQAIIEASREKAGGE